MEVPLLSSCRVCGVVPARVVCQQKRRSGNQKPDLPLAGGQPFPLGASVLWHKMLLKGEQGLVSMGPEQRWVPLFLSLSTLPPHLAAGAATLPARNSAQHQSMHWGRPAGRAGWQLTSPSGRV